ncbi:MAG: tRNA (adenosine(37)-N6)-dimethylallyltransferase MiaA, partial [Rhodospirillaceae bacterium]
GKSRLALDLAVERGGEIVNADSMQIYRELPILTARPGADDTARVPHHLYAVQSVAEPGSAGAWLKLAAPAVADIRARGHLPIVCGGTGLYLKVLREGIAPVPDVPSDIAEEGRRLYAGDGGAAFHARVAALDAAAADRLPPADRQRLIRAWAVVTATGRTLDDWQAEPPTEAAVPGPFLTVLLAPDRERLYARIDARFDAMVGAGALDEVAALDGLGLDPDLPALKALGVPEIRRHLAGEVDLDAAVDKSRQATRNFAKRQMTWYRHQLAADLTLDAVGAEALAPVRAALDALEAGAKP